MSLRVAFHAINGVGLGHLVRCLAIANELPALIPGVQRLIVTNARDLTLLERAGIDHVQLPARLAEPHADLERVHTALPDVLEEAALVATFEAFRADLVVFDTHAPIRVVQRLTAAGIRSVLIQRELRPEALKSFLAANAQLAFDKIVVPHDADEVDPVAYQHAVLVGPIVRGHEPLETTNRGSLATTSRDRGRPGESLDHDGSRTADPSAPDHDESPAAPIASATRDPSTPGATRIVAVAGGGGQPVDATRYLRAVADAHLLVKARVPDLETILVTGPYAPAPANLDGFAGLTLLASTPELPALLASADLVVSQAGYNAIAEIRTLAKPAVLVPGYRKAEDQRERALRLERAGAAVLAKPNARSLANAIERALLEPGRLAAMAAAHRAFPLVPKNASAAAAIVRSAVLATTQVRRVAIVAHDYAPKLGGMESVARSLAGGLHQRGIAVDVYTTSQLGSRSFDHVQPLFRALPRPLRIDLWADLLATLDRALADEPDVIHLCHAGLGPWIPALRAALPCVVTANVHGNDLLAPWVQHGGMADYPAAQLAGLSAADAVVCVSKFARELAWSRGVREEVLRVVENGIDPERFSPAPGARESDLARRLKITDRDQVVLTVSRLVPRKGHRTTLHAIAKLVAKRPRLKFVFTGAGEVMRRELMTLASELGIASRVIATGFLPDDELPALYRLADVFALLAESPTDEDVEGFGVALLEAAASGVPTIATRSGGVPEAIADGETGLLVPPGDADAAAAAIDRLLDTPAFGAAGRARVVSRFSSTRVTEQMLAVWTAALREPRVPLRGGLSLHEMPDMTGVELVRLARQRATAQRTERSTRRAQLRRVIDRDRLVRLRATGDGGRLLPDALADCIALGHAPRVEVKLRRFVETDFQIHALPHVDSVELVHGVPYPGAVELLAAVSALPPAVLARVKTVRLFVTPEARVEPRLAVSAVPEAHALRKLFAQHGAVVVPPPELTRYLSERPAGGPETGMIEPTNLCNLACPTCPTGTGKIKPLPAMTLDAFDGVLGQLRPKLRNLALWNYGEPLLNKELPQMIGHAKAAGVGVVKVSSNVHFLDGERGAALLRSGLDVLILSVDGASQATYETFRKEGDFETVARSVAWLCSEKKRLGLAKPRIELQFIAMRHNEHELPEMRRLAHEWGVDALRIKTFGAEDNVTKQLVPTSRLLSRYEPDGETPNVRHAFCTMAWDHTVVNVDGSVTPCCYLRPDMGDAFVMGNVFETSFPEIWRGEKYRAFRAQMLTDRGQMPICNKCRGGTHDLIAAVEEVTP